MALSYGRLFSSTPFSRAYPVFLLRRIARIYPLYLVILVVTATQDLRHLLQHHVPLTGYGQKFVANLLFLHGIGLSSRIVGSSWSVGAEFAAYLILPLLLLATTGKTRAITSAIVAYVVIITIAYPPFVGGRRPGISGPLDITAAYSFLPVVRCVSEFTIGLCLFYYAESLRNTLKNNMLSIVLLIVVVIVLSIPSSDILFVPLSAILIASLLNNNVAAAAFSWRPVFLLGELSYAIYLWHRLLFALHDAIFRKFSLYLGHVSAEAGAISCFWVVLIGVSYISYRLVEVPGRRFVRNIERRLFPAEDAALCSQEEEAKEGLAPGARTG